MNYSILRIYYGLPIYIYLTQKENDDLLAQSHTLLNIWKNYFTQLLNVWGGGGVIDIRQTDIHSRSTGP
jgi:hypothetical protein